MDTRNSGRPSPIRAAGSKTGLISSRLVNSIPPVIGAILPRMAAQATPAPSTAITAQVALTMRTIRKTATRGSTSSGSCAA